MSHLVYGVHEQSYVAHVVGHAGCMGPYASHCQVLPPQSRSTASSTALTSSLLTLLIVTLISTIMNH